MAQGPNTSKTSKAETNFVPVSVATRAGAILISIDEGIVGELYPDGEPGEVLGIQDGKFQLIPAAGGVNKMVEVACAATEIDSGVNTVGNIHLGAASDSEEVTVDAEANTISLVPGLYLLHFNFSFPQNNFTGNRAVHLRWDEEGSFDNTLQLQASKLQMAGGNFVIDRTSFISITEEVTDAEVVLYQNGGNNDESVTGTLKIARIA